MDILGRLSRLVTVRALRTIATDSVADIQMEAKQVGIRVILVLAPHISAASGFSAQHELDTRCIPLCGKDLK